MNSFRILNANIEAEYEQWVAYWQLWPNREVMAHPDYVRLFTRSVDNPICAVQQSNDGCILFPFILRPLSVEPWANQCKQYDLVSPYGYGGAFTWGDSHPDRFWSDLEQWAKEKGVICLFTRLSLFSEQLVPFSGEIAISNSNVVRSLRLTKEELWMDYEHKVRKNVKKGLNNGLHITIDIKGDNLEDFLNIYYSTMTRRNAQESYYFSETFFRDLITRLEGQYVFFHVWWGEKIISTELVLLSQNRMYSFLGGTMEEAFDLRPNDLLKHAIIEWGMEQGKDQFVLGGGFNGDDGIFRYKLSFAPKGIVPFKIGKLIYQPEEYHNLVMLRKEWENQQGNDWIPQGSYFPEYRA